MANPHFTRVDTHRILLIDESVADEGGHPPGYGWRENQGDYIHDVPREKKVPRDNIGVWLGLWSVLLVLLVAIGAFVALVMA